MVTIEVYVDTGNVFRYKVEDESKAREHAEAITRTGYRSVQADKSDILTWWPSHRIVKVKMYLNTESSTKYFDEVVST